MAKTSAKTSAKPLASPPAKPEKPPKGIPSPDLPDDDLLDAVQRQTFRYFWDFAHPVSGLIRERTDMAQERPDLVTIGGTGFGVMAIVAAAERGWVTRAQAAERLLRMVRHLFGAPSYHGVLPHWMDGRTGATIPFGRKDDGGDLVETAFLIQGLLCARQYFDKDDRDEAALRGFIQQLWLDVEWSWYTRGGTKVLYWHWSPNHGFSLAHEIRGWNECLITYVLAASAPRHAIDPVVYHDGYAQARDFRSARSFHGIELPLGPDYGGPLAFAQYSFLGLDPRGLTDRYADYFEQNVRHARISRAHCIENPGGFKGYGPDCWGLTANESDRGYREMSPTSDIGVIAPTAAIGCLPYVPEHAIAALRHFLGMGKRVWGEYGFLSSFCEERNWYSKTSIAIDQGPIVVMIENYRTGLLWKLFMSCPEIQAGLARLGFTIKAAA